jgi:predicted small metal-binding protein
MKTVACKDMGVKCPWVGKAGTIEELAMKAKDHAMTDHKEYYEEKMKNMSDKEAEEMIKPYVKEE